MTAKAPAVTFTNQQFNALLAAQEAAAAAAALRERQDAALVTTLTAVARPGNLSQTECGALLIEAGGATRQSPFYTTDAAQPGAPPVALTPRELAALPLGDFYAVTDAQFAAEQQGGSHPAPFYRKAAGR